MDFRWRGAPGEFGMGNLWEVGGKCTGAEVE